MNPNRLWAAFLFAAAFTSCQSEATEDGAAPSEQAMPDEPHLSNVRQLTFGGDNAEAYWGFGGNALVYQTTQPQAGIPCDQIFVMPLDSLSTPDADVRPFRVSSGLGRTTCP